jgi:hypothetical protein
MHRATSPFVVGKYALKKTIQQYQFFWRQDGQDRLPAPSSSELGACAEVLFDAEKTQNQMSFGGLLRPSHRL